MIQYQLVHLNDLYLEPSRGITASIVVKVNKENLNDFSVIEATMFDAFGTQEALTKDDFIWLVRDYSSRIILALHQNKIT